MSNIPTTEDLKPKKIFNLPIETNLGNALTGTMKSVSQHEGGIKQGEINLPSFKEEVIKTEEDAKIFVEAIENIPEPNEKLKKAFRDFNKQETLEEVAEKLYPNYQQEIFIKGAKWQAERMYSEEELKEAFYDGWLLSSSGTSFRNAIKKWFEQFKKK